MNTTKIVGRATVRDAFGNTTEKGFSCDDMEGFQRFLNMYINEILHIEFTE